jgi:hypothetical protein
MRSLFFIFMLLNTRLGFSQGKHDYNWLMGMEKTDDPDYPINCMNELNFGDETLSIRSLDVDYRLYVANASISNKDGDLLFYSNGCDVKNANHEIMPNGSPLNPGESHENSCPDGGYATVGGIIALPMPNDDNKYYLFHQAFAYYNESPFVRVNRLYYSIVDMALNNGLGDVTIKNQAILSNIQHMGLQAVRHANNQDWWVFALKRYSNEYYRILLTEDGIAEVDSQAIGELMGVPGGGQMAFSPDGTKFANYDFTDQLTLFDLNPLKITRQCNQNAP